MYKATGGIFGRHSHSPATFAPTDHSAPLSPSPLAASIDVAVFADKELTNTEKILIYLHERAQIISDELKDLKADDPLNRHFIADKSPEISNILECVSQGFDELQKERTRLISQRKELEDIIGQPQVSPSSKPLPRDLDARSPSRLELPSLESEQSKELRRLKEKESVMTRVMALGKVDMDQLTTWQRLRDEAEKEAGLAAPLEVREAREPAIVVLSPRNRTESLFATQAGSHGSILGHSHAHNNMLHAHTHFAHSTNPQNAAESPAVTEEQRKVQRDKLLLALIEKEISSPKP